MVRILAAAGRKLRQLRLSLRHRGLGDTLYWAAYGYLRPNRFVIFARELGPITPRPVEATLELWTADRLRRWRAGRPLAEVSPECFQDEVDGVGLCAVARRDTAVVGLVWIYRPGDPSRMFRLRPGEFELNYEWVRPDHRGRGIFTALVAFAMREMAAQGYRRVYAMVHSRNLPSMRALVSAGCIDVAGIWHFFLFRPAVEWCDPSQIGDAALPALEGAS